MKGTFSVGQVNTYIKNMFNQDFLLNKIYIKGEVSNCKYHTSGHIYFSLKDETGAISCVMFAGSRKGLAFPMKNGDKVIAGGSVSVYERDGKYQLYAREITLEGAGLLYERFLALKKELEEMGMFAQEYKQPIPSHIRTLGVVTAPTGAAVQDIKNVALRRNPFLQIILYPALVQGEGAVESICRGIQALDAYGVDVMIVGRGGGSIEDLWAFNEEAVARAIFNCTTPVISAVGHETDTTIADYAADLRAPTPSAAAELAVEDIRILFREIEERRQLLARSLEHKVFILKRDMERYYDKFRLLSPENQIREKRQHLMDAEDKMEAAMKNQIYKARRELDIYIERLKGLSPLDKLNQGFSYVEDQNRCAVTSIDQVKTGDPVVIRVSDGCLEAEITGRQRAEKGAGEK